MKNTSFLLVAAALAASFLFFTGCSKITLIDVDPTNDTLEHSNNDIVCMLSQLPITANVCSEIASVINRSVRSGFDEDFLFKELWATAQKYQCQQL